jgi:DNA-binding transcriptional MerR regulator
LTRYQNIAKHNKNGVEMDNSEKTMSIRTAAQRIGRSISTLRNWHRQNILVPEYTLNGIRLYTEAQVIEFMESNRTKKRG